MPKKKNAWLAAVLEDYYAAAQVWDNGREAVNYGRTEVREYEEANPKPRLKDFLRAHGTANEKHAAIAG